MPYINEGEKEKINQGHREREPMSSGQMNREKYRPKKKKKGPSFVNGELWTIIPKQGL